jgi:hypothetical protein
MQKSFNKLILFSLTLFVLQTLSWLPELPARAQVERNFVRAQGDRLTINGQPVRFKGSNFYPQGYSWAYMWLYWDAERTRQGLRQAAELGNNAVRIMIPYGSIHGWTLPGGGRVDPDFMNMLRQFLQAADEYNIRSIVTLFDFEDLAVPGSQPERWHREYAADIVNTFKDDDRILAWDLHNEPDNYNLWRTNTDTALAWLAGMRDYIRSLDPNHLITIGVGRRDSYYYKSPAGHSIIGLSDFISHHSYNADALGEEIYELQEMTGRAKPIVLEETGWPTGPIYASDFTPEIQAEKYRKTLKLATDFNISGVFQWALYDKEPTGNPPWDDHSYYYGLIRRNGELKPSYTIWRDGYKGDKLPSAGTKTNLAYSRYRERPFSHHYFPQTDHYLATPLYELWRRTGGSPIWGFPLTDGFLAEDIPSGRHDFLNDQDKTPIMQYFEKGRFEYHRERRGTPEFERLKDTVLDKYFYLIDLGNVGSELATAKGYNFPPATRLNRPNDDNYQWFDRTNHSLQEPFLSQWRLSRGEKIFGAPISEPFEETNPETGQRRLVQYFEKARLEYRPEFANTRAAVETGNVGSELLKLRGWLKKAYPYIEPLPAANSVPQAASSNSQATATGFADAAFEKVWRRTDEPVASGAAKRSWLWGEKPGVTLREPYKEAPGGNRLVQYFDKTRMELTNPAGNPNDKYFVTNGLLVREMIEGRVQTGDATFETTAPAQIPLAGDAENPSAPVYASLRGLLDRQPDRTGQNANKRLAKDGSLSDAPPELANQSKIAVYNAQTGHNIPAVLWDFMTNTRGVVIENGKPTQGDVVDWLFSTGLPISDAYWTRLKVGGVERDVLVQAFERRVLTFTPSNPDGFKVEMGNVGLQYASWRYGNTPPASGANPLPSNIADELNRAGGLAFRQIEDRTSYYRYTPRAGEAANAPTLPGSAGNAGEILPGAPLGYIAAENAGRLAIYLHDLQGNRQIAAYGVGAALRPDRAQLAHVEFGAPERADLFLSDLPGGASAPIANNVLPALAWSADGRKLAFYYKGDNRLQIALRENGSVRMLHTTPPDTLADAPVFSPDGNWLVYTLFRLAPDDRGPKITAAEIRALSLNTGDEKLVADKAAQPVFAPDGSKIAALSWGENNLLQIDWSGGSPGGARNIATALGCILECANTGRPAWSPDSRWLVFTGVGQNLQIIGAGGGTVYNLTAPGARTFDPIWTR